ncbi:MULTISPECIES: GNAT family N-acetyltransferase [Haloarcula]|uniref:N-acetyltransferase n=1 Tax=Haloarcula pellucida TaxID=1427151 RepID=A0A830GLC3_9EURY|nr:MULTISPECIES: GNAT family protein [Halomicroarcula]MBX0349939.1 GNAT family N-acetyltransferase [Halomicroarcula pellucida]MDS0279687.1 GNAT family N-acetyltransferase [Halomicroarcula sp. S1AR25-4]GGN95086.1 N-acetyltransferase [Halomicroarcula pellucida]
MPGPVFCHSERLTYRLVDEGDYEFVRSNWNNPHVWRRMPINEALSRDGIAEWVEADETMHLLVCSDDDPETPLGLVYLFDIAPRSGHAELGYWLVPEAQGQGYATEAVDRCLQFAFGDQRLHKVIARIFAANGPSRRVVERFDFREEGRLREYHYTDGEYRDLLIYGLLSSEWDSA